MPISPETVITLRIIRDSDITPTLDAAIREGLVECYPDDRGHFSSQRAWHSSPDWVVIAQAANGIVAGHLAVVERRVTVGDNATGLDVAGIQGVFVRPSWRKTGLFDRIMEAATKEARSRGLDAGLLFCLPVLADKVYCRLGWQTIEAEAVMTLRDGERAPIPDKNVTMVFPLGKLSFPGGDIDLCGPDW